ncbi:transposase domain-containing protein [Desulfomicrobium apsheronum]|uniref:transposase domain-containing protein n=1 Tax=Desulfomicrobium apsheronum TaxID=52560 RepID=UPI0015A6543C
MLTPAPCSFSWWKLAKANEIEPQAYLKYLFERFPAAQTTEDMKANSPLIYS